MISHLIILLILVSVLVYASSAAVLPTTTSMEVQDDKEMYLTKPTEILPIQPILIYPSPKSVPYHGRALFRDNKIIYIKLLKLKNYRPKRIQNRVQIDEKLYAKDIHMKNIFYVKATANGQFSHTRLKLYRLPEFYAITVYRKQPHKE